MGKKMRSLTPSRRGGMIPDRLNQLLSVMYEGAYINPVGPFKSPLCLPGEILRNRGVTPAHVKVGLISLLALNSANLGNPLALEIVEDEGSSATNLLTLAIKMSPDRLIEESTNLSPELIYARGDSLKGKAIVGFDSSGFQKAKNLINQLIDRDSVVFQHWVKTSYTSPIEEIRIEGPISWVVITRAKGELLLTHPSAVRIYLNPEGIEIPFLSQVDEYDPEVFEGDCDQVRYNFGRLEPRRVKIPYAGQLAKSLQDSKVQDIRARVETISNMIRNIAIINNPPGLSPYEVLLRSPSRTEQRKMAKWMKSKGLIDEDAPVTHERQMGVDEEPPIVATKVDYYIFKVLMDEFIMIRSEIYSDRQTRIFNTIKRWNYGRLVSTLTPDDEGERLRILSESEWVGIDRDRLYKELNTEGCPEISPATLYNELKYLLEKRVIGRKNPKGRNKDYYYVTTTSIDPAAELPVPSKLEEPAYEGRSVEVINPVTGEVETI